MKVVVDTNVLIAAFLTVGTSREVLETVLAARSSVLSPAILSEFREVLLSKKFQFSRGLVEGFIQYLSRYSKIIQENAVSVPPCSDPGDQKILALCQTVQADFLITGDQELLDLKKVGATVIIRPGEFWKAQC